MISSNDNLLDTGDQPNDFLGADGGGRQADADLSPLDRKSLFNQELNQLHFKIIGLQRDSTFNRKIIYLMADAIQECRTREQLAETMATVLSRLLSKLGHRTFPDTHLNKDFVRILSRTFKDKVEDIVRDS